MRIIKTVLYSKQSFGEIAWIATLHW